MRIPQWIVIVFVWCYWLTVLIFLVRSRLKFHVSTGAVPTTRREALIWLIWVPTILAWQVVPTLPDHTPHPFFRAPVLGDFYPNAAVDWLAVLAAGYAYLSSIPVWLKLGKNWSLAIVRGKESELVTDGVFSRIRHPIYSRGLLLMAATVAAVPSLAMWIVGGLHLGMVLLKVNSEEKYLKQIHGDSYRRYCQMTNRFFPRFFQSSSAGSR